MSLPRSTPFDLVFEPVARTTFPAIRLALEQGGHDPRDRDAFLMLREVVSLLRELRPDEGLGEAINQLAALIHHAYLFWDAGCQTVDLPGERLLDLLSAPFTRVEDEIERPAYYARVAERRIWAQVVAGQPPEPLDGCFVHSPPMPGMLRVLGVFGIHPERAGFSVVEVVGPRPLALGRVDGTTPFTPILPGGAAARLLSLVGEEELLELGWRIHELGARSWELEARSRERGSSPFRVPSS